MKRLRTALAAVLIAFAVSFSSCTEKSHDTESSSKKTAYMYSQTGVPIDTIENISRFFHNGEFFQLRCSDGSYIYTNQPVIIKVAK